MTNNGNVTATLKPGSWQLAARVRIATTLGLRLRFFLLFVGLAIGPILTVCVLLGQVGYSTATLQSQKFLEVRAQHLRDRIESFFTGKVNELTTLGILAGPGISGPGQFGAALQSMILRNNAYQEIYFLDHRGHVLDWYSRTAVTAITSDASFHETPVFKVPASTMQPYLGDIRLDTTIREPLVTIAVPFADPNTGELQRMLLANVRFKAVWDFLAGMEREKGVDAHVTDTAGRVVAHRNPAVAMQGFRQLAQEEIAGWPLAGVEVLTSKQRAFVNGLFLTVVVEQDIAVAQEFAERFFWTTMLISLFALMIAMSFYFLYERGVIVPLGRLMQSVMQIRRGKYPGNIDVGGYGEVGMLADSFARMTRDLRVAQDEVQKAMETLEQRVEERTAKLRATQETLLRHERLATLGQLTGTVAHEIRNPLGVLASSIHLIRHLSERSDLDLQAPLDRADRSLKRCDKVIAELLDSARAGEVQIEPVPLNSWLLETLNEQQIPDGIELETRLSDDDAIVRIDPDAMRRAVINLIENACHAMGGGGRESEQSAEGRLTVASLIDGVRFEITISDTGCGIPEDIRQQVFEPLFSTKSFGTGLGLSTVQRIMEKHGGGLKIVSEEGQGTQVVLWVPLSDPADE